MKKMIIAAVMATTLAGMATAAMAHRPAPIEQPAPVKPDFVKTLFDQLDRNAK